jgi:AraC-like DNA-binding protein
MDWERMVVARRLLGSGWDSAVVSDRLGFSHPNSFRRAFSLTYGMSISRFLEIREGGLAYERLASGRGALGGGLISDFKAEMNGSSLPLDGSPLRKDEVADAQTSVNVWS